MMRFRTRLSCELLETRANPSGNVTATVLGGSLRLVGDAGDNDISVSIFASGSVSVLGNFGTTVNGGSAFFGSGVTKDVRINLNAGNDALTIDGTVPRDLRVDLGTGDFDFMGTAFGPQPSLTVGRSLVVNAASVGDFILFDSIIVNGDAQFNFGAGNDGLAINQSIFHGNVDVNTGAGDDYVEFASNIFLPGPFDTHIGGRFRVRTGAGADVVRLTGVTFESCVLVDLGNEDDQLFVNNCVFQGFTSFDGGAGTDILQQANNAFESCVHVDDFEFEI